MDCSRWVGPQSIMPTLRVWLSGHAVRCAVDLGLDKSLRNLSIRVNEGKVTEGEVDQNLVRACRTWCALFVFGTLATSIGLLHNHLTHLQSINWRLE
jgi:hypothetical protein